MKSLTLKAPCRIDLAGGTIDLWPLYLYFGGHTLCHMAVNIFTTVTVEHEPSKKPLHFNIESLDLETTKNYPSLDELGKSLSKDTEKESTRWINRLLHAFFSKHTSFSTGSVNVKCQSEAPPGSGLGGSSVLGVTLWTTLEQFFLSKSKQSKAWDIQQFVRDLEAVEIEHPAGDQDYVPALFGGLLLFNLQANHREVTKVSKSTADKLASRLALVYTGQRHHSGINNWELFTNFHKWGHPCRDHLAKIHKVSREMANDLSKDKIGNFEKLLNAEWASRKKLGEAVNAPSLQTAWRLAKKHGATARKACGAGGGGCLLTYFPTSSKRDAFLKTETSAPVKIYSVEAVEKGLCS